MTYIFDRGEEIQIGSQGEHDVLYADGDPVPDTGQSTLVFEEGTGLGGDQAKVVISDSQGESEGDVSIIERSQTVEDYYGYAETDSQSAEGDINFFLELRKSTFYIFKNQSTAEYSFGWVHDVYRPQEQDTGGDITIVMSGLPGSSSYVVRDDNPINDSYSLNPPDGSIAHLWDGENTDGVAIGKFDATELQGVTVTFDVTQYEYDRDGEHRPEDIKFAGDDGTTVERAYDGTNSTIEITFGSTFGE